MSMETAQDEARYRLNELGWVQFERLCAELIQVEGRLPVESWQGRADATRIAFADARLRVPLTNRWLPGQCSSPESGFHLRPNHVSQKRCWWNG